MGEHATAAYDFEPQLESHLRLTKGDHLEILERHDEWVKVNRGGDTGLVPTSYIRPEPKLKLGRARAAWDFARTEPQHLALTKGDLVDVVEQPDEHWVKVDRGGDAGLVPARYVQMVAAPMVAAPAPAPAAPIRVSAADDTAASLPLDATSEEDASLDSGHSSEDEDSAADSAEEGRRAREEFDKLDQNGDGDIDLAELRQGLRDLNHALDEQTLRGVMDQADSDGDGKISFEEFEALLARTRHAVQNAEFSWLPDVVAMSMTVKRKTEDCLTSRVRGRPPQMPSVERSYAHTVVLEMVDRARASVEELYTLEECWEKPVAKRLGAAAYHRIFGGCAPLCEMQQKLALDLQDRKDYAEAALQSAQGKARAANDGKIPLLQVKPFIELVGKHFQQQAFWAHLAMWLSVEIEERMAVFQHHGARASKTKEELDKNFASEQNTNLRFLLEKVRSSIRTSNEFLDQLRKAVSDPELSTSRNCPFEHQPDSVQEAKRVREANDALAAKMDAWSKAAKCARDETLSGEHAIKLTVAAVSPVEEEDAVRLRAEAEVKREHAASTQTLSAKQIADNAEQEAARAEREATAARTRLQCASVEVHVYAIVQPTSGKKSTKLQKVFSSSSSKNGTGIIDLRADGHKLSCCMLRLRSKLGTKKMSQADVYLDVVVPLLSWSGKLAMLADGVTKGFLQVELFVQGLEAENTHADQLQELAKLIAPSSTGLIYGRTASTLGEPEHRLQLQSSSARDAASQRAQVWQAHEDKFELEQQLKAEKRPPLIPLDELAATWEDQQHGYGRWNDCFVNGGHLRPTHSANMKWSATGRSVYRAVWKQSIPVAIKKMPWGDPLAAELPNLMNHLVHPHITRCFGILEADKDDAAVHLAAFERCGISLERFLQDESQWTREFADMSKLTILWHITQGLDALHSHAKRLMHGKIHCASVILDGHPGTCDACGHQGKWKLCDMDLIQPLKVASQKGASTPPQYFVRSAAPERLRGGCVDTASDIYSLGIVMWEIFTRSVAYCWLDDEAAIADRVLRGVRPVVPPGVDDEYRHQIRECLRCAPENRPTASDVIDWVREQRSLLQKTMDESSHKVKESDAALKRPTSAVASAGRIISMPTEEVSKHWTSTGRFSQHKVSSVVSETGRDVVRVEVVDCSCADWQEPAKDWTGSDTETSTIGLADDSSKPVRQPVDWLGLSVARATGWRVSSCQYVTADGQPTVAACCPSAAFIGSMVVSVTTSTGKRLELDGASSSTLDDQEMSRLIDAEELSQWQTPFVLEISLNSNKTGYTSIVEPWLRAGLAAVAEVRHHEATIAKDQEVAQVVTEQAAEIRALQRQLRALTGAEQVLPPFGGVPPKLGPAPEPEPEPAPAPEPEPEPEPEPQPEPGLEPGLAVAVAEERLREQLASVEKSLRRGLRIAGRPQELHEAVPPI
jgi:serine/threonine protein kinase